MEENKKSNKKVIIVGVSAILLIAILGVSFAIWNYSRVGDNQILVAGDVYMKFKETPALTIENAIPSEGPGENDYFEFTIEGKNTYSKPIWYEIDLLHGEDHATRKTRIKDNLLKFRLVEIKDGNEQIVVDNASYNNLTNKKIWINTIAANTRSKVEITYRLYMWISSDTIIGNTSDAVYDMDTWNNDVFASIKVNVSGDFNEKELESGPTGVDMLKETLGKPKGMIGVTNDNKLVTEDNGNIREWRYSGLDVNNYIYYNCNDISNQTKNSCELWRIVGVFKDENDVELIKIVKNESLTEDMLPLTYTINGNEYELKSDDNTVYWNKKTSGESNNDWATAGLQYFLNTENDDNSINKGYLSYLKTNYKNMINDTMFYLGNFYHHDEYLGAGAHEQESDTIIEAYEHERDVKSCIGNAGANVKEEGCYVWGGNKATWIGKIGLLYLSDYGFSTNESEWNKMIFSDSFYPKISFDYNQSWLYKENDNRYVCDGVYDYVCNKELFNWLISPSTAASSAVTSWFGDNGELLALGAGESYTIASQNGTVYPCLYLKTNVKIKNGDGSQSTPYELSV